MKTIPTKDQIKDFLGEVVLTVPGYAIYFANIVDKVADHFSVSKGDKKLLSGGHRYCHDWRSIEEKPTGSILDQRVEFSLRALEKDEAVSLIGGNFWQAGNKKYISRTPTARQIAYS